MECFIVVFSDAGVSSRVKQIAFQIKNWIKWWVISLNLKAGS